MKRQWQARRTAITAPDGRQRWDQAYQLLLRWAMTAPSAAAETTAPAPVLAV